MRHIAIRAAAVMAIVTSVLGCGGGNTGPSDDSEGATQLGSAQFSVSWPEPSRLIPRACNSIVISIASAQGVVLATQTIPRPPQGVNTSSVVFQDLVPGDHWATATAFPVADGTGVPQATGKLSVRIEVGVTTQGTLTMGSTIKSVAVIPSAPNLKKGESLNLAPSAKDDQGRMVLLPPGDWGWLSSNAAVVTVDPESGLATGVGFGVATITATEKESGVKGTASVTVSGNSQVTVSVSPPDVSIQSGAKQQFTAFVNGISDQRVTWTVPNGGGSIDANGLLTAGTSTGSFTVVATSVSDTTKSGSAHFQVVSGTISVTVQPSNASLMPGELKAFVAQVSGAQNTAVVWSATGGTISSNGEYKAGNTPGLYAVTATSVEDPNAKGGGTVTIIAPKYVVTVKSANPANNVHVDAAPADLAGKVGGDTEFDLEYGNGSTVTLTARDGKVSGNTFDHWLLSDGTTGGSFVNRTITFTCKSNITATAIYTQFWQIDVRSVNSNREQISGVPIQVSKPDRDGYSDGVTWFSRNFSAGTSLELMSTAQEWPNGSGNKFLGWCVDGQKVSSYLNVPITMSGEHIAEAVFAKVWIATVIGQLANGTAFTVPITVSTPDLDGKKDGQTTFIRRFAEGDAPYGPGSISFTAPATYGGKSFDRWRMNSYETTNRTFTINGSGEIQLQAIYK